jgi:hypothetical protein
MTDYTVDLYEPISPPVTADTTLYTADNIIWPTADGGLLAGAQDFADAEVIPVTVVGEPGGGYRPLPRFLVTGIGLGVLPEPDGDAIGIVAVTGRGLGKLSGLAGNAQATAGIAGRSIGHLASISAAASGKRGQLGTADGVLKELSAASVSTIGVRGAGIGTIAKCDAAAIGRCDDETAVIALLLAA